MTIRRILQLSWTLTLIVILYLQAVLFHESPHPHCTELATTGLQQLHLSQAHLDPFWVGDELSTDICEFTLQDAFNFHFPHTMQQLYRCWSLWRNASNPVLVFPRRVLPENNFIRGYIDALEKTPGLRVVRRTENDTVIPVVPPNTLQDNFFQLPSPPYYAWLQPDDARALRDNILTSLELPKSQPCGVKPNITILNRNGTRALENIDEISALIGASIVTSFDDDTSFRKQVDFFRSSDLVVSPHGAQLTGLTFLPDCGGVLEVFPVGYYLPHFFGSLAAASGLNHGFLLLTKNGEWVSEIQSGMQSTVTRSRVRSKSLCPRPTDLRDAVERMVRQWEVCCGRLIPVSNNEP